MALQSLMATKFVPTYRKLEKSQGRVKVVSSWAILVFFILLGIISPLLPLQSPTEPNPMEANTPPSLNHWFGTDPHGMDVFSRTVHSIRIDFALAISSVILGILVGTSLGAIAGYLGGVFDDIINRLSEVIQGFPQILFGMAVLALAGDSASNLVLICAFYNVPVYAKMVRSVVVPLREAEFVQAAKCAGNTSLSIVFRHLIPNALVPVFSQFPLSCAYAIQMIAGLSFIGLGIKVPTPEWGSMINLGANYMVFGIWWPSVFPGLAIFLSVWALSELSDQMKTLFAERV